VLAAPGPRPLLLALLAAVGGDVLLTRPCAEWYAPQARLLGRTPQHVPVSAESGGVPDPFALLETVRRARAAGGDPRVLVISVADDPTGSCAPPELVHEVCEAAADEGLLIISDETHRDTLHDPHGTVLLSPAEMLPRQVVVLTDLAGSLTPACWPAAVARFPDTARGVALHAAALRSLAALGSVLPGPVAEAVAHALTEPPPVRARTAAMTLRYASAAAGAHRVVTEAGALSRPPQAGHHFYVDLGPLRPALATRSVTDSAGLEELFAAYGGLGGHRLGDDPDALRVRLSVSTLLGPAEELRARAPTAADRRESPHPTEALTTFAAAFTELTRE
ncbi:aminotransferase class I/II-fold pyridoxal phosphate-dependent enzyme, partial [Streptomyces sp. H27-D2]|uniref:aminotransferase class I/II-fold pyridoxal phosphate-dependent enzyme n=1 Tax=Streptomyces sp. H27-D2 TaxID=3046304 RepID=UPI002DB8F2B4